MAEGGFLPPTVARLMADISEYSAGMQEAIAQSTEMKAATSSNFEKAASIGKAAWIGLGVVAAGVAVVSVKAAEETQVAHARLTTAVAASHQPWTEWSDVVEKADHKATDLGFTVPALESSLARLVPVTTSSAQATSLMNLAEDVARGRHMDLESATQLLVKVQTGHVSLLGRLGINTKDATGATISQEEAVRRLSELYGGQATAYSKTFAGQLDILKAKAEEVAAGIGSFLIPKIEELSTDLIDGAKWLGSHRDAAIALGVVIGGPLVAAMGAYVVEQAMAIGGGIVEFWGALIGRAVVLASSYEMVDVALAQNTVELLANAGAAEVDAVALLGLESAGGGAAGSLLAIGAAVAVPAAIVVGVVGAMYLAADAVGYFDDSRSKAYINGQKWATAMVRGTEQTHDAVGAYKILQQQHELVGQSLDHLSASMTRGNEAAAQSDRAQRSYFENIEAHRGDLDRLTAQHDTLGSALDRLKPAYDREVAAQKAALQVSKDVELQYGVKIPASLGLSGDAMKAMQTAVKDSTAVWGAGATQHALDAGLMSSDLEGLVKSTQTFASSMAASFSKATDPFAHFGDQAAVSEGDMESFFTTSEAGAQTWAATIQRLIGEGVDVGIVQEMAKAGPSSQPALDAFSSMVDAHGVEWVNSMATSGQSSLNAVDQAFSGMALTAAVKGAEFSQVVKAYLADAESGGNAHLVALEGSADQHLAAMAWAALLQMGSMRASIQSVPTESHLQWTTDGAGDVLYSIALVKGAMEGAGATGSWGGVPYAPGKGPAKGPFGAEGGIFTRPTRITIGEAGDEVLIPLTDRARALALASQSGLLDLLLASHAVSSGPGPVGSTPSLSGPSSGSSGDSSVTVVVVRSEAEAMEYVPEAAKPKAARFLAGRTA